MRQGSSAFPVFFSNGREIINSWVREPQPRWQSPAAFSSQLIRDSFCSYYRGTLQNTFFMNRYNLDHDFGKKWDRFGIFWLRIGKNKVCLEQISYFDKLWVSFILLGSRPPEYWVCVCMIGSIDMTCTMTLYLEKLSKMSSTLT